MTIGIVDARGVSKSYESVNGALVPALSPIDLTIGEREFVAIVGPSGCGKTTLLRMIGGLETRTEGSIEVGGENVRGPHRDVAIVFQRAELLEWRTIRRNITLPVEIQKRRGGDVDRLLDELLEVSGLTAFAESYPHELSGGMQQRAAIARALLVEPRVLLLDEPFGALDAMTREKMNLYLSEICERSGVSVLLITHSFDEAVLLADRVIVLSERPGRVLAEIEVDLPRPRTVDTLRQPKFREIVHELRSYFIQSADAGRQQDTVSEAHA